MSAKDLDTIRAIVQETLTGQPVRVYLFGSQARGTARRGSDVDLAIDHETPLPIDLLPRLRERLEEAPVVTRVDVVDMAEAAPYLRSAIEREGLLWIA